MASAATQLRIPSAQNTAPVLEFRCLYTHDLRQKKKRWQDGILRFHTFNKRVMVYDVPLNFIGDTHWREEEFVRDGAELRLDKGVLVEVGEATGTTEQDLTELLGKARPIQERIVVDANARSKYPPSARSTMMPLTQLRPKSLNALLGTPRGAYGRAILPAKSPFESRSTGVDRLQENERPTKRQRLDSGVEIVTTTASAASAPCKKLPSGLQTNILKSTASRTTTLPKHVEHEAIISIDSDDDGLMPSSPVKPAVSSIRGPSEAILRLSTTQQTPPRPSVPPPRNTSKSTGTSIVRDRQAAGNKSLSSTEVRKPINRLRSAATKSRQKLMYRELLRPQAAPKSPHDDTRNHTATEVEETIRSNIHFSITNSHLGSVPSLENSTNVIHAFSQKTSTDVVASSTDTFLAGKPWASKEDRQHIRNDNEKQSLFISQDVPRETDTDMEFTRTNLISDVPRKPITTLESRDPIAAQPLQYTAGNSTLRNDCIPYCNTELPASNQIQIRAPHLADASLTRDALYKPGRPVRRGAVLVEPRIPFSPQRPPRSPLKKALSESNGSERLTKTLPTKLSLQRASSDLSRTCRTSLVTEKVVKEDATKQDKDLGPWGREAFDIFGWKPGDRKELAELTP